MYLMDKKIRSDQNKKILVILLSDLFYYSLAARANPVDRWRL